MSANANDCWWMGTLSTGGLHTSNTEPLAEAKKQQNKKQKTCGYGSAQATRRLLGPNFGLFGDHL